MLPTLHIYLLGDFRLVYGEQLVTSVSSPRLQSLLAYLVLHRAAPQSRRHMAFLLWPDSTEAQARTNLRFLLHQLRQTLPASEHFLAADAQTLQWRAGAPFSFDVDDFDAALAQATSVALLRKAIDLYHGDLLPSFYDDWLLSDRERLRQRYVGALEKLTLMLEDQGDYHTAIQYTQLLLRQDSLREATYRQLMRLHALSGDPTGVLRAFRTCEIVLKRELDSEVSAATRDAYEQLQKPDPRPERAGLPPPEPRHHNLPIHLTSFIGRELAIAELRNLLSKQSASQNDIRLLTLTGAGGCGKTRLALQAAGGLLDAYSDGVWLVELAQLSDPALVPHAVAGVLGVREQQGRSLTETLSLHLQSKSLLLILDNCEHLLIESAQLAEAILQVCAHVQIFATSRERLNVAGETVWLVPTLSVPAPEQESPFPELQRYEAIHLFVERAAAALPTFELTPQNAALVTQICRSLDGIPLAVELAAARVKTLTGAQISERLVERFRLLTGGSRTALPKQQTLRATMDWSYVLLSIPERVLFRRLSVFAGGWTLEAAESVCADVGQDGILPTDVLDLLSHLVDKSLVVAEEKDGVARYRMLQTIRQYSRNKLSEAVEGAWVRARHAALFLKFAEDAKLKQFDLDQLRWLDRLEIEHDNLRTAMDWSVESGDAMAGLRFAGALGWFWDTRGYHLEGVNRASVALTTPSPSMRSSDRASALNTLGVLEWRRANYTAVQMSCIEALAIARECNDQFNTAMALFWLGSAALEQGELIAARELLEQAVAVARAPNTSNGPLINPRTYVGPSLARLGEIARMNGEDERAVLLYEEAVTEVKATGSKSGQGFALKRLGYFRLKMAQPGLARALAKESLAINLEVGDMLAATKDLALFAAVAVSYNDTARAARLFGAVERSLENLPGRLGTTEQKQFDHYVAVLRAQLDESTFRKTWAEGRAMTVAQAITESNLIIESPPSPTQAQLPPYPAGLTTREVDVLRLLAQGLSDAQIA